VHGTKQQKGNEETKSKNRDAQKKRSSHLVRGVSREAGRESVVGKICVCVCVQFASLRQYWPLQGRFGPSLGQQLPRPFSECVCACVLVCVDCQISMNVMVPLASHVVFMEPVMVITHLVITPATATLDTTPPTAILNAQVTFIPCIGRYEVTKT